MVCGHILSFYNWVRLSYLDGRAEAEETVEYRAITQYNTKRWQQLKITPVFVRGLRKGKRKTVLELALENYSRKSYDGLVSN